jgi:hypothetical protein
MRLKIVHEPKLGTTDLVLLLIFFIGIYLGVIVQITAKIPFPSAPSGVAGLFLLWRRRDDIVPAHLGALFGIVLLYLFASFCTGDLTGLSKRFTGLVQLTYSFVIGYAMFLTLLQASRAQLSRMFLGLSLFILVGSLLESYAGLDRLSDAVRQKLYDSGIYEADLRDQLLYGKVRPKLFTSEPSAVTFGYTLFTFSWFVVSQHRHKLLLFVLLMAGGLVAMPGPTLLLGLLLLPPYYLFVLPDTPPIGNFGAGYRLAVLIFGSIVLLVFAVLGATVYAERLGQILNGNDPSFFYRVIGPALVAFEVMKERPWAGSGLTGENFIADLVMNVFVQSSHFSAGWRISKISEVLTNYFWLHWIYLGVVWGIITFAGVSIWLRLLGAPSLLFCWIVWIVFGQASGAYVAPKTWVVLLLAAALSMLHQRVAVPVAPQPAMPFGRPPRLRRRFGLAPQV